jgi:1-aminocyclopropane-1-carboxylate deaminase
MKENRVSLSDFPRYPLMFGPSPVHRLDRLSQHLGGAAVWAKREDCNSGLAYGGNKIRKLEYLVPDALAGGATHLVSIGGVQSNHTRQVAAVAAKLGLKARLVQESWVDWPDPLNDRVGNIMLSRIMGAQVELVEAGFGIGVKSSWEQALEDVRAEGGIPYPIPAGASDHRLGGLGFANWAYEVQQQERESIEIERRRCEASRGGHERPVLAKDRDTRMHMDNLHRTHCRHTPNSPRT